MLKNGRVTKDKNVINCIDAWQVGEGYQMCRQMIIAKKIMSQPIKAKAAAIHKEQQQQLLNCLSWIIITTNII